MHILFYSTEFYLRIFHWDSYRMGIDVYECFVPTYSVHNEIQAKNSNPKTKGINNYHKKKLM